MSVDQLSPPPTGGVIFNIARIPVCCKANQQGLLPFAMSDGNNKTTRSGSLFNLSVGVLRPIPYNAGHSYLLTSCDRDPAGNRAARKLRDVYYYCGRWYGEDGNFQREKYIFPIDEVRSKRPIYAVI